MFDSKNWSPQSSVVVPGIAGVVLTLTGAGTVCGILSVLTAWQRSKRVLIISDTQSPCSEGSTCIDLENNFKCQCQPGFTGMTCGEQIDEGGFILTGFDFFQDFLFAILGLIIMIINQNV